MHATTGVENKSLSKRLIAADGNAMTITLVGKVVPERLVLGAAIVPKCD